MNRARLGRGIPLPQSPALPPQSPRLPRLFSAFPPSESLEQANRNRRCKRGSTQQGTGARCTLDCVKSATSCRHASKSLVLLSIFRATLMMWIGSSSPHVACDGRKAATHFREVEAFFTARHFDFTSRISTCTHNSSQNNAAFKRYPCIIFPSPIVDLVASYSLCVHYVFSVYSLQFWGVQLTFFFDDVSHTGSRGTFRRSGETGEIGRSGDDGLNRSMITPKFLPIKTETKQTKNQATSCYAQYRKSSIKSPPPPQKKKATIFE